MATPYSLVPSQCGHSYCALCILKVYLNKFHDACKSWHQVVECPMCRSVLPYPKQGYNRSECACPFTPNRLAEGVITGLMDTLTASAQELYNIARANRNGGHLVIPDSPIAAWREKGSDKIAWKARQEQGKSEMALLTKSWKTIRSRHLLAMKRRLGLPVMTED